MKKPLKLVIIGGIVPLILFSASCAGTGVTSDTASTLLLQQINLRKKQLAEPTPERLEVMKSMGMSVDNIAVQRVFIYLAEEPSQAQREELESLGIKLYIDSWIPPVGVHPTGYLMADLPVDQFETLDQKDYVVRLDTAERQLEPQRSSQPQLN